MLLLLIFYKSFKKSTMENHFYKKSIIAFIIILLFSAWAFCQGSWSSRAPFGGTPRWGSVSFTIGTKAYIGLGNDGTNKTDFWEYDQATNQWSPIAPFPGAGRYQAVAFAIGNKGYVGTGAAGLSFPYTPHYSDFWEYDPAVNQWSQKAAFPGTARFAAVGFSIGNKGYIGTGFDAFTYFLKDFWEYDQATNQWTQRTSFTGTGRMEAAGFSIGNKGYIGTGGNYMAGTLLFKDFWEFDPAGNQWSQKATFTGTGRSMAVGFAASGNGYIGLGGDFNSVAYGDFWEYNQGSNQWLPITTFAGTSRWLSTGFAIGNEGYVSTGGNFAPTYKDLWEFTPAPTGIQKINDDIAVSISPNPAADHLMIRFPEVTSGVITLMDLTGNEISTSAVDNRQEIIIPVSGLSKGVYLVRVLNHGSEVIQKVLVM
jgi:N-acetylneuraminic acid mutarotase